jgi:uncharacterized protein (UPF0332 family)
LVLAGGLSDNAMSEAYYAMLDAARAALIGKNIYRKRHRSVLAAFGEHFSKSQEMDRRLHRWIIAAEKDRLIADYSAEGVSPARAQEHLEHAEIFVAAIRKMLEKP